MKFKAVALILLAIATATPAQAGEFDDYLRQQRYDNAILDRANARTDNIRSDTEYNRAVTDRIDREYSDETVIIFNDRSRCYVGQFCGERRYFGGSPEPYKPDPLKGEIIEIK
jgi:hypothetical protein